MPTFSRDQLKATGFRAPADVRGRLQADLFHNRERRLERQRAKPVWADADALFQIDANRAWLNQATYPSIAALAASNNATFARDGSGTYENFTGEVLTFAADIPREGDQGLLIEPAVRNEIRNSIGSGAVAGDPGTLPTNWSRFAGGSLSWDVTGVGEEDGLPYIEMRLQGTAGASSGANLVFEGPSQVDALSGEDWTGSVWVRRMAGSVNDLDPIRLVMREYTEAGATVTTHFGANHISDLASDERQRFSISETLDGGETTAHVSFYFEFVFTIGAVVDITLRFYGPQLETGLVPHAWVSTESEAVTKPADELTLFPAAGDYDITVTFDDDSTQLLEAVEVTSSGWEIPTDLDRRLIKSIVAEAA